MAWSVKQKSKVKEGRRVFYEVQILQNGIEREVMTIGLFDHLTAAQMRAEARAILVSRIKQIRRQDAGTAEDMSQYADLPDETVP